MYNDLAHGFQVNGVRSLNRLGNISPPTRITRTRMEPQTRSMQTRLNLQIQITPTRLSQRVKQWRRMWFVRCRSEVVIGTNNCKSEVIDFGTGDAHHLTTLPAQKDTPNRSDTRSYAPNISHPKDRDEHNVTASPGAKVLNNPELVAMALADLQKSKKGGGNGPNMLLEGIEEIKSPRITI